MNHRMYPRSEKLCRWEGACPGCGKPIAWHSFPAAQNWMKAVEEYDDKLRADIGAQPRRIFDGKRGFMPPGVGIEP